MIRGRVGRLGRSGEEEWDGRIGVGEWGKESGRDERWVRSGDSHMKRCLSAILRRNPKRPLVICIWETLSGSVRKEVSVSLFNNLYVVYTFSVVCTLIDNGTRHHNSQNTEGSRGAAE